MIKVQVRPNEPLEAALRRFKRQCNYAGIFRLAKKYAYHEKSSDKRRREERERVRNIQRAMRKMEDRGKGRGRRKPRLRAGGQTMDSDIGGDEAEETTTAAELAKRPTAMSAVREAAVSDES